MLKIETDYAMGDSEQIKTRIQAFMEIIQGKINRFPFFSTFLNHLSNHYFVLEQRLNGGKLGLTYRLTKVVPVHGCSCKLPQYQLGRLLEKAGLSMVLVKKCWLVHGKTAAL